MRTPLWIALAGLVVACGSESSAPASSAETWRLTQLQAESPGDEIVARVNGRPVFASCVEVQAKAHKLNSKNALQECIDFELLAQAAEAVSMQDETDVQAAAKRELVRVFVETRYGVRGPGDIPDALVKQLWKQIKTPRYNHPELRDIVFCRIKLEPEQGPESNEYQVAQKFLNGVYEELRDREDLKKNDLFAPCYEKFEAAGVADLTLHTHQLRPASGYQKAFRPTIFAPKKRGTVTPPLHTRYGWDLILVTVIVAEKITTLQEAEPELRRALFEVPVYESGRDELFEKWYAPFAKARTISTSPENIPAPAPVIGATTPPIRGAQ
ncbi:MAG: hypothetical protein GY811_27300 [Myxococcales bacterium]|nr:hypothetical protein [Myxococcales bacterium]